MQTAALSNQIAGNEVTSARGKVLQSYQCRFSNTKIYCIQKVPKDKLDDAGEPAPEDGDIEELSDSEMLLNRESNPGLPRLVGVNDKRKS
jgi:hypothetical protein